MSIAAVSNVGFVQPTDPPITRRHGEDYYGRQLEKALQAGDLGAAQQSYNQLASFGPNNSGPFRGPVLSEKFQELGQAIQAGDLGGAQQAIHSLGNRLLQNDRAAVLKDIHEGGRENAGQSLANLKGDYWAVYGRSLPWPVPRAGSSPTPSPVANSPTVDLQA